MKVAIALNDVTGRGGVERVVINTATSLVEYLGYDVDILSVFPPINQNSYINITQEIRTIYIYNNIIRKNKIMKYITILNNLKTVIKENKYDIVISNSISIGIMVLFVKLLIGNFKIVAWEQSQYDNSRGYLNLFRKFTYRFFDLIVSLSKHDRDIFKKINKNSVCIYNYIDSNSNKSQLTNKRIIAVGRLAEEKGFDLLIQAFAIVSESYPNWCLDIYGEGPQEEILKNLIESKKLNDRVYLLGFKENLEEIYPHYTIFVLSSLTESFGMVLLEAMNHGLACVSHDCKIGPLEIIVDRDSGLLAKTGDVNDLANKIIMIIEDETLRKNLSKNALIRSNDFSRIKIIRQWNTYLKTL